MTQEDAAFILCAVLALLAILAGLAALGVFRWV